MLWEAVDVRAQYGHLDDPDAEHLCIAILVLEGVIEMIASGNWDGLIEAAVDRLSPSGRMGVLQTIVDPDDVRDPPAPAILVKFHGCAVACVADSIKFRHFLVGAERDITHWPNIDDPMHREVERIATNKRGLFVGLSLQDTNLRNVFSKARTIKPWPWPPTPHAQAQLFCEDQLGPSQELVLESFTVTPPTMRSQPTSKRPRSSGLGRRPSCPPWCFMSFATSCRHWPPEGSQRSSVRISWGKA
jgi:hypothetical protein